MAKAHRIVGLLGVAFAAFIVWMASGMRFYTGTGPGPGFFPVILGLVFGALSLVLFAQTWRQPDEAGIAAEPWRPVALRVGGVVGLLLLTVPGLTYLGFRLTMFFFCLTLLAASRRHGPVTVLAFAAIGSFGAYYLFADLLRVPLPIGRFGI